MYVAILRIELRVGDGTRAKQRTVRSIVDKLHRHFNVSVAEVDRSNHSSESVLGFVGVAGSRREVRETLDRVADAVAVHPRIEVLSIEQDEA